MDGEADEEFTSTLATIAAMHPTLQIYIATLGHQQPIADERWAVDEVVGPLPCEARHAETRFRVRLDPSRPLLDQS